MAHQQDKRKLARKRLELWAGRVALLSIARLVCSVPEKAALRAGSGIGSLTYHVSKRYRTVAIQNLTQVYGDEWDRERIERTARDVFRHMFMNLVEFLRFQRMDPSRLDGMVRIEGEEHAREALSRGRGVVAVTAHFGNFELFGAAFSRKGYPVSVIARDADDGPINDRMNAIRARMGYTVLPRNQSARNAMAVLRRNEVLGVLPDQNDLTGIFVPFFGRLAATTMGPAFLAVHTGATVLPAFIHREPDNYHVVKVFPPIEYVVTGDHKADVRALTARINDAIETGIREHPEQWFWLHDRWRHRPPREGIAAKGGEV